MPLFNTLDVDFRLDSLEVLEHSDRWFGVEPYIVPVFFKIDGERYRAILRIFNTQPPIPGTTQVVETTPIQLQLLSEIEQQPLIALPEPPILQDDENLEAGATMSLSHVRFQTTLQPIPAIIDILGLFNLDDILEALASPIAELLLENGPVELLNLTFDGISQVIAALLGLDEQIEVCPSDQLDLDGLINQIEAELNGLIPGTIGGVFVAMENDDFDEDDAQVIQNRMRTEVVRVINDITNSVARVNPIPDIDPDVVDPDDMLWTIIGDLLFRWDVGFWFLAMIGWLWGAPDDYVGFHVQRFEHRDLQPGDNEFSPELIGSDNRWLINGRLTVQ